jgi:ATP phosphoribosyltransferase regulatory subunit
MIPGEMVPEGTRPHFASEAWVRRELRERLFQLFTLWGYAPVELPALERYDPLHPLAARTFNLIDRNGEILSLRAEFTTALARLIAPGLEGTPLRLQYAGELWLREADAELGRLREFSQVGLELIGVSSPQVDAELLELAWEALQALGFEEARLEVGLPALVGDLLSATGLAEAERERLRRALHRKNIPELEEQLKAYGVRGSLAEALLRLPDLYGEREVLREARQLSLSPKAQADLDWLAEVLEALPHLPLLLDLGRARRLDFYTGINFQAYTPDFGLPLLGGGRYDGTLLPKAAGLSVGLDRALEALGFPEREQPPEVLALDRELARALRREGRRVELAWTADREALRAYALKRGIRWLALEGRLEEL